MYDLNNDMVGREHYKELLNEAAQERRARQMTKEENLVSKIGAFVSNAVDTLTNARTENNDQTRANSAQR